MVESKRLMTMALARVLAYPERRRVRKPLSQHYPWGEVCDLVYTLPVTPGHGNPISLPNDLEYRIIRSMWLAQLFSIGY
jgi:hypothetical protein